MSDRELYQYDRKGMIFNDDPSRIYVCEKCGEETLIRHPRLNVECPVCGGRMHRTERKY